MTNEEIAENGRRLFQSTENLRKSIPDLYALIDSLRNFVEEEEFFGEVTDLGDEDAGGKGEWLSTAYAYNAGVMSSPKRVQGQKGPNKSPKQIGTISIITRLCNSDDLNDAIPAWPWLNQACLIVAWHPKDNPEDNWEIENFEPNDENVVSIVHLGKGLWSWREDEKDYAYFFVLPIFALRNEFDLKRFALHPLKLLFDADDPGAVAEDAFRNVHVLMPQSG